MRKMRKTAALEVPRNFSSRTSDGGLEWSGVQLVVKLHVMHRSCICACIEKRTSVEYQCFDIAKRVLLVAYDINHAPNLQIMYMSACMHVQIYLYILIHTYIHNYIIT